VTISREAQDVLGHGRGEVWVAARRVAMIVGALLSAVLAWAGDSLPILLPAHGFVPREHEESLHLPASKMTAVREDALAHARLWLPPPRPIAEADLRHNPAGPKDLARGESAVCKFLPRGASGATPKFYCAFEDGEVLKVKYGDDPEINTEVAATRLAQALGAGADRMYLVKTLRCFGCPEDPEAMLTCVANPSENYRKACGDRYGLTTKDGVSHLRLDYSRYVDFGPVAIERRAEGTELKTENAAGWGWDELDRRQASDPETRAARDALRLFAVLVNDWDNRPDNQRLLCLPGGISNGDERCRKPFAYVHDLGATFGRVGGKSKAERKLDLDGWRQVPVWKDAAACRVGIDSPIFHGATFGDATISEAGRRLLADRLGRLRPGQIRDLFEGSGFATAPAANAESRDIDGWVKAFQEKVLEITRRPPCPAA
jgi:hypothetical protein